MSKQEKFYHSIGSVGLDSVGLFTVDELFKLYDSLDPVETSFMMGEWTGGVLKSGHPGEGQLIDLGWVGKKFTSTQDVTPIVVQDENGHRTVSDVMGQASLREVKYRGKVSATMIYDTHAIIDYFRQVDENTVMGVMDSKALPQPLFFYLQRLVP